MKQVLEHIQRRNVEFAASQMFEYLRGDEASAEEKLAFAPHMAHFVFSFMDINRFILRDERDPHPHQQLVNIHTEEDAHHWPWYLHDLAAMGMDKTLRFSDALRFLWSDATIASRMLTYHFCAIALTATPTERLAIVETVETTGNSFLNLAAQVSAQVRGVGAGKHVYYGKHHARCESGHHMGTPDVEAYLDAVELSDEERARCCATVDRIYALYTSFTDEMYRFAKAHSLGALRQDPAFCARLGEPTSAPGAKMGAELATELATELAIELRDPTGSDAAACPSPSA